MIKQSGSFQPPRSQKWNAMDKLCQSTQIQEDEGAAPERLQVFPFLMRKSCAHRSEVNESKVFLVQDDCSISLSLRVSGDSCCR